MEGLEGQPHARVPESRAGETAGLATPGRDFPGRAESLRRAGEPDAALRLARQGLAHDPACVEGHVAEALALLDLHQPEVARRALERALEAAGCAPPPPAFDAGFAAFGDSELDSAFAEASAERDSMIDADGIAFEAMRAARLDAPEQVRPPAEAVGPAALDPAGFARDPDDPSARHAMGFDENDAFADEAAEFDADSPFHTRSMAELLERQGDPQAARAIRTELDHRGGQGDTRERRAVVIERLERWLARLRGGNA